jgi:hypothetical protein
MVVLRISTSVREGVGGRVVRRPQRALPRERAGRRRRPEAGKETADVEKLRGFLRFSPVIGLQFRDQCF